MLTHNANNAGSSQMARGCRSAGNVSTHRVAARKKNDTNTGCSVKRRTDDHHRQRGAGDRQQPTPAWTPDKAEHQGDANNQHGLGNDGKNAARFRPWRQRFINQPQQPARQPGMMDEIRIAGLSSERSAKSQVHEEIGIAGGERAKKESQHQEQQQKGHLKPEKAARILGGGHGYCLGRSRLPGGTFSWLWPPRSRPAGGTYCESVFHATQVN